MNLPDLLEKLKEYAYSGTLGAFAALVGYLYQVARHPGSRISVFLILTTIVIGFYLGVVFGSFIPKSWENRDAVLLLVGATGLKGFEIIIGWSKSVLPNLLKAVIPPSSGQGQGPRSGPGEEGEGS